MKKIALTMRGIKIAPKAISSFPKVTHLCLHIFTSSNEVQIKALELVEQLQTLEILIVSPFLFLFIFLPIGLQINNIIF